MNKITRSVYNGTLFCKNDKGKWFSVVDYDGFRTYSSLMNHVRDHIKEDFSDEKEVKIEVDKDIEIHSKFHPKIIKVRK